MYGRELSNEYLRYVWPTNQLHTDVDAPFFYLPSQKPPEVPIRVVGLFPLARSVWQAAPGAEPTMNASYRKNNRSEQASMQSGGLRQGEDHDE